MGRLLVLRVLLVSAGMSGGACGTAEPERSGAPAASTAARAAFQSSAGEAPLPPMGAVTRLLEGTTPEAVVVRDERAYVADVRGVSVYRLDPAGALALVSRAETPGKASDLAVAGRALHVADGRAGLATFTLDDPDRPRLAGQTAFAGECSRVVGSEHAVAVLCTGGHLGVIRPGGLVERLSLPGEPRDAAWIGERLYVAASGDGLVRVELSPGPAHVATRDRTWHRAISIAAVGTRLFVGLRDKRVIALDAATAEPRVLGELSVLERPMRLAAGGTALLVASSWPGSAGATWLDLSSGQAPLIAGRLPFSVAAGASTGASPWLVARGEGGLSLLDGANGGEVRAHVEGVRFERLAMGAKAGITWARDSTVVRTWSLDPATPLPAWSGSPIRDAVVCDDAVCALHPDGRVCRTPFQAAPSAAPECVDVPEGGGSLAWQASTHRLWMLDGNGGLHRLSYDEKLEITATVPRAPMVAQQSLQRFVVEGELGVAIDSDLAIMHVFELGSSPRRRGDY
jgi:hypothetical protein